MPVRFSEQMIAAINELMEKRNSTTREEPWTFSDFIRHCVTAKLKHGKGRQRKRCSVRTCWVCNEKLERLGFGYPHTDADGTVQYVCQNCSDAE